MNASSRRGTERAGTAGPLAAESGQATAEMAVLALLAMFLIFVIIQAGLVARDTVTLKHVARDAAREASVGTSHGRIEEIVERTVPDAKVRITGGGRVGAPITVEITARIKTSLPMVGHLAPDFESTERVTMRAER